MKAYKYWILTSKQNIYYEFRVLCTVEGTISIYTETRKWIPRSILIVLDISDVANEMPQPIIR